MESVWASHHHVHNQVEMSVPWTTKGPPTMPRDRCMRSALATRRGRQHARAWRPRDVVKLIQLADALPLHTVVDDMHRAQGQIHKQSAQAKAR